MAFCQNTRRSFKVGVLFTSIFHIFCFVSPAIAQTAADVESVSAISIARQIEELSLVEINSNEALTKPETSAQARKQILEALPSGNQERFDRAVNYYHELADERGSKRDFEIINVYERFSEIYDFQKVGANYFQLTELLEKLSNNNDWLVKFHAKRLLSIVHTHSFKNGSALRVAQEALDIIPNDLSSEAVESRIFAIELLAFLQNVTANKDLALYNTQRLINLKLEANQPIDGIELINNLMFSLNEWREYETRLELAKTLKRLEDKFGSTTPGLSSTHIARINNDIGNYKEAKIAAQEALDEANINSIKRIASIQLATAHAGLGNTIEAKNLLSSIEEKINQNNASVIYANALIALQEGKTKKALSLLNQKYDRKVTQILKATNRDTMEMLAELENSSERQAEREAALQREAALIQTKLDQQQRINKLLYAFMVLIALTGICALLFARHRDKLAKLLAIKSREAESADRMKTEFLGMVSHELRTPLNGIIGLADVLTTSGPTEEVRQRGDIILTSGNILFALIESIIDMSRLEAGKLELAPEPTQLKALLEKNLDYMERGSAEKGITFTSYVSPDCDREFELDPARIEKCVNTLLCNALKFTTEGRIHLHVTAETDQKTGQSEIKAIVADTGQGISEEVQAKLFTPFLQADASMTRKHGGSGLRLAISRMLARMMDGDITLNSKEGCGSEFILTFKAKALGERQINTAESQIETLQKKPSTAKPADTVQPSFLLEPSFKEDETISEDLKQCRALIVEDLRSNQDVIAVMLNSAGIEYVPVDSGENALSVLQTQHFDFVLMDVHMPGMDGIETTRRIRGGNQPWSDIPIIALTADAAAENNAACMAAGVDIFLTKPVMSKDLLAAIEKVTDQPFEHTEGQPVQLPKKA